MIHSLRYLAAFGAALAVTLVLTPLAARLAQRLGAMDSPSGHKTHTSVTPYLGGLAVMGGLIFVGALAAGTDGQLLTILACAVALTAIGLLDDLAGGVSPWLRLGAELSAGAALWLVGVQAGVFAWQPLDFLATILWVAAVVNAFNMTDNMDGLAGGAAFASCLGIGAVVAGQGDYLVASFAFAVAGAALGFLRSNFPPAKIFLGDAGSMLLGFLVAALTLHADVITNDVVTRLVTVGLLAAVPLFDLTLVVVARLLGRRPVWLGSTDHTSHRLAHRGHSRREVALAIPGAQLACSIIAFTVAQTDLRGFSVAVLAAMAIVWIGCLAFVLRLPHPAPRADATPERERVVRLSEVEVDPIR
jgi:UDP-GlcNAc:undecaprenyl-phosphate GlcNAc-1-phosphate transferase